VRQVLQVQRLLLLLQRQLLQVLRLVPRQQLLHELVRHGTTAPARASGCSAEVAEVAAGRSRSQHVAAGRSRSQQVAVAVT
jgi:hypothetical protein